MNHTVQTLAHHLMYLKTEVIADANSALHHMKKCLVYMVHLLFLNKKMCNIARACTHTHTYIQQASALPL